jgi:nicotinamidase-related amidase
MLLMSSFGTLAAVEQSSTQPAIRLTVQTRDPEGKAIEELLTVEPAKTAIVVIDMWDRHWCKSFTAKVGEMVPRMNPVLEAARKLRIQIIFAPSDVLGFYKDSPQRKAMQAVPPHAEPKQVAFNPPRPPGPTDFCECGPDRPCQSQGVWTRQHADLKIADQDLIGDCNNGRELMNLCAERGIDTLLYMGVASNMCVLDRSMGIRNMKGHGLRTIAVGDMAEAITSNGLNAEGKPNPAFTPAAGTARVQRYIEQYVCPTVESRQLLAAASPSSGQSPFTREEVAAHKPKGPTRCFRHLCYDYNWPGRTLADLPRKFTRCDPVELAEFSRKLNLDAVLLLAVPHHGYTTYPSVAGTPFPALVGKDWYGQCVKELHQRDIAVFGYITLGTNWKYMRDNLGKPYIHGKSDAAGVIEPMTAICFNAPGYIELVEAYTRELLTMYPIDAIRYDMLFGPRKCLCDGCKAYYRELYGQELSTWEGKDRRRVMDFYLATLDRPVNRLTKVARQVKPSVEIWQNHINTYSEANVNLGRQHDVAYIEFGEPARLLALKGILNKDAIIIGQTLKSPIRRTIMALGARCYQYVGVNQETALPGFDPDLAGFFKMVSQVQPYLDGAKTASPIGVVFSEATRFRYDGYDRKPYMDVCEKIAGAYLKRSLPLDFINVLDLQTRDLTRYKLLVLPLGSGLTADECEALRRYARGGGTLLVAGDALRHDPRGMPLDDFALADVMGLHFEKIAPQVSEVVGAWSGGAVAAEGLKNVILTRSGKGESMLRVRDNGKEWPLLHVNGAEKGRVAYLATVDVPELTGRVIDSLAGPMPIAVSPADKQVILTRQERHHRWILHLLSDGDYSVDIHRDYAAPTKIADRYPADDWSAELKTTSSGVRIEVRGNAKDRLLVLQ